MLHRIIWPWPLKVLLMIQELIVMDAFESERNYQTFLICQTLMLQTSLQLGDMEEKITLADHR